MSGHRHNWDFTFTGFSVATSYNFKVLAIILNEQSTAPNNRAGQFTTKTATVVLHLHSPHLGIIDRADDLGVILFAPRLHCNCLTTCCTPFSKVLTHSEQLIQTEIPLFLCM